MTCTCRMTMHYVNASIGMAPTLTLCPLHEAAPDLLAALERIDQFPTHPQALDLFVANVRGIARAAIAKVKGGSK